ncbi:cpw-wpc domain-containing protein [Besnoitia besnoiti]|uniref:Cpw-wpc domain-containing protein n=1 Tax=Besnoitia besnoiti TaxID=94643 RepID=A0A2A9MKP2_BESBE|nr:cpw-wpc domain-containing protein [Besnoitia besnoiti]PFH35992.1 cpw-wpc domain-containing protein [Besnoitia besnoiti]
MTLQKSKTRATASRGPLKMRVLLAAAAAASCVEVSALNPLQMMKTGYIADEFKLAFDALPTTEQLVKNAVEMEQLDEAVAREVKRKPVHLCEGPSYKRNYTHACPAAWEELQNGQCWGRRYRGPCEALHFLRHFSEQQKKRFVEPVTGDIIRPKS